MEEINRRQSIVDTLLAVLCEISIETEEHMRRLVGICQAFSRKLGLPADKAGDMMLLAEIHDIGKIGIRRSILLKPAALTPEEWLEMKRHPEIGYRIARASPELSDAAENILCHHERWDGKGYPRGLKGKETPLACRIFAVADAYDAMTNDRVYRKAVGDKAAVLELRENAGSQFDPDIVEAFIDMKRDSLLHSKANFL